ncbi:MAG: DEAD/DEAH box helicase [Planctomycetota bacterium]|nr:DEAD/DEAH box helicase [Planctomycetota bacterium]
MDPKTFLQRLKRSEFYANQVAHVEHLPARSAQYAELPGGLDARLADALAAQGIRQFYTHQASAISAVRAGRSVVIVTGTASGKTLCYNVPIVESLLADPSATALCLYPTKALTQDQLRGVGPLVKLGDFLAGTYDGDTPANLRRRLRDAGNVILTNPDMLHQGILPHHARWNRLFSHLKYVVIDEIHAYRGVFGSHLANVLRRLRRICKHYGADPTFICCSATIANPKEHAERIAGVEMTLIDNDGSPKGGRDFVLWNPPPLDQAARGRPDAWRIGGDRRSPIGEAVHLLVKLITEGVQTIAFVRTRLAAELIFKSTRDILRGISGKLGNSICAYRGGYLPEERREIERKLANRELLGVASTNALELGIDIGTLDAAILVGYPGTIASLYQQAGRAGRAREESLVFLLAQNAPIDQYLMAHSSYLFARNPEQAVVDPDNPHVAVGHIRCAAHELPLAGAQADSFGPYAPVVLDLLEEDQVVKHIDDHWYWASSEYPAAAVNLRNISGCVYTIQDVSNGDRVIGTMDEISALSQLHDHAVYLHAAETYFVAKLDLEKKIAFVERKDLDYYTQSVQTSQIRIDEVESDTPWEQRPTTAAVGVAPNTTDAPSSARLGFGDVTVTTTIPMFKKIRFHSRDSLGYEQLELPPQQLETVAMWFVPPAAVVEKMLAEKLIVGEGLVGIANVLVEVAPLFVMCDTQDIGAVVDARCLGRDALFLYDRYPGGMGYARRCLEAADRLFATIRDVIRQCGCSDGCPSCVGAAIPAFAQTDLDSATRGRIPDKRAALFLMEKLLRSR